LRVPHRRDRNKQSWPHRYIILAPGHPARLKELTWHVAPALR
jgi:hypothetical protein